MNKLVTIETPEESSAVSEIRKKLKPKKPSKGDIEKRDTEYETPEKPSRIVRLFIKRHQLKKRIEKTEDKSNEG